MLSSIGVWRHLLLRFYSSTNYSNQKMAAKLLFYTLWKLSMMCRSTQTISLAWFKVKLGNISGIFPSSSSSNDSEEINWEMISSSVYNPETMFNSFKSPKVMFIERLDDFENYFALYLIISSVLLYCFSITLI